MPTHQSKSKAKVAAAMREVHTNMPSTMKPGQSPKKKEAQLRAIAFSKARKAGARVPKPKGKKA